MLEQSRKSDVASIKNFLEDDIVFYLNKDRVSRLKIKIENEKPLLLLKYTSEISDYLGKVYTKDIEEKLKKKMGKRQNLVYHASQKLCEQINTYMLKFDEKPIDEIKRILNNTRVNLNNSKIYKGIIGKNENDNSKDLQQLLHQIKKIEIENENLINKIKDVEKEIRKTESEVSSSLIELETIEKKIDSEKKEENSFNVARKILKVSKLYKEGQLKICLNKIEVLSVKKFEDINKKENYISKISIDPDTFNIVLYDNKGIEKDINILSAGEKQLMISAIVWSIFKLSDRNNIFIFDTPLARLDKVNRELFVEKILCTISDQVLILSTDEEIVGSVYSIVKKSINKEYELVNDEKTGSTKIKEAYFNNEW